MQSPKERYENDSAYRACVDAMEKIIYDGKFSPSEMREMAVMATIHHEMRYGFNHYTVPFEVSEAFKTLSLWRENIELQGKLDSITKKTDKGIKNAQNS